jgi:NAD-dependent dihydropyrimidine dehydrogenase PreA subunit
MSRIHLQTYLYFFVYISDMADGWFPIIDEGRCKEGCLACIRFCPQKVFGEHHGKAQVKEPGKCLKGCDACEAICLSKAIRFLTTRFIEIDGLHVGINGIDDVFARCHDFERAFQELSACNYIPESARERYRVALLREFRKVNP